MHTPSTASSTLGSLGPAPFRSTASSTREVLSILLLSTSIAVITACRSSERPTEPASSVAHSVAHVVDPLGVGYDDTPYLPGSEWRVHDKNRPVPKVVTPPPFTTAPIPADAIVLFDGKDLSKWTCGGKDAAWKVVDGVAEVNGTGTIETRESFGDCRLHVEWAAPAVVEGESQHRGNSGIFLMGRYEVQVLDSFENRTYADGQAAALYGQVPPLVNACRRPGEWQTYDIDFQAPRFDGDRVVSPAIVTVVHNGVLVQDHVAFLGATRHREVATYEAHAATLPLALQDHGNPVRYRNVWIQRK